jgi:molybdenum cofactor cytidylyltransferase
MTQTRFHLAVVLLAAGASSRMGRPKLLLPWGSSSVLAHLLALWRTLGAGQIGIVCPPGPTPIASELDRLGVSTQERIVNPEPERGMFSSIQTAAKWTGWRTGLTHWAIVLGDQPQVAESTLRQVLEFATRGQSSVCQPAYRGRPRHPVIVDQMEFARLSTTTAHTLREFLHDEGPQPALCEINDPTLDLDLDTPADYQAAVRIFFPSPAS